MSSASCVSLGVTSSAALLNRSCGRRRVKLEKLPFLREKKSFFFKKKYFFHLIFTWMSDVVPCVLEAVVEVAANHHLKYKVSFKVAF